MKLKELLKHHNINWPSNATHAVQDEDGWIKFATNPNIKLLPNGCWDRGSCPQSKGYVVPDLPLASDWNTAIVSHPHPHAELMLQYAQDTTIGRTLISATLRTQSFMKTTQKLSGSKNL